MSQPPRNPKSWIALFRSLFSKLLYSYQLKIVHAILHERHNRVVITASTRAGKSYCVAMVAIVYALLNPSSKTFIISATSKQAHIIMEYIYGFIIDNPYILEKTVIDVTGREERAGKRMTLDHVTFKNKAQILVLSGEGKGERLLGHGVGEHGGLVIVDESPLIEDEVFSGRIMRMLGDSAQAQLIEIGNPIKMNHFYQHYVDPTFYKIHISWGECVAVGRLSKEFIEEQKKMCTPSQFKVLYDAVFVDELTRYFPLALITSVLTDRKMTFNDIKDRSVRIGVDFGRKHDLTAISIAIKQNNIYELCQIITLKDMPLPEQRMYLENIFTTLSRNACMWEARLDMTGIGWAITEELQRKFQAQVRGINFGAKMKVPALQQFGQMKMREHVSDILALNMKVLMVEKRVTIVNEPELVRDLEDMPEDLTMERTERGHFDCFVAAGLSLLPDNFSSQNRDFIMASDTGQSSSTIGKYLAGRGYVSSTKNL